MVRALETLPLKDGDGSSGTGRAAAPDTGYPQGATESSAFRVSPMPLPRDVSSLTERELPAPVVGPVSGRGWQMVQFTR
jgi:hypothetical protein